MSKADYLTKKVKECDEVNANINKLAKDVKKSDELDIQTDNVGNVLNQLGASMRSIENVKNHFQQILDREKAKALAAKKKKK